MSKFILLVIIFAHIFILSKLVFFPYPELFIYPYLTNHGLKPYSQILDQHFPGLMFLPINLDNLGMNNENSARLWLFGIVFLTHILLFLISKSILDEKKALVVNLLYLAWQPFFEGWVLWIDSFLPLLLLPAFYSLYKRRIFLAGIFLGTAIVLKQVMIPLAVIVAIYIFLEGRRFKQIGIYLVGLLPPIILMLLYLISIGSMNDFWYWTVIFNLTTFAQYGKQTAPSFAHILRVGVVFGASFVGLFAKDKKTALILSIFIMGSLASSFARFDFVHFQPALPLVLLSTIIGVNAIWKKTLSKVIVCVYFLILVWWLGIFYRGHLSDKVLFFDESTLAIVDKMRQYTNPGEKIFIFGAVPHLYQMSQTLPAGDVFVFQFPWFLMVAGDRILQGVTEDRPKIVVADRTVKIEGQPITEFAKKIDQYIQQNYQIIDQVGTTAIMRRNLP